MSGSKRDHEPLSPFQLAWLRGLAKRIKSKVVPGESVGEVALPRLFCVRGFLEDLKFMDASWLICQAVVKLTAQKANAKTKRGDRKCLKSF